MVGIPVADVVVVHVLVDILRKRLGGTKRFPFCINKQNTNQMNKMVTFRDWRKEICATRLSSNTFQSGINKEQRKSPVNTI